MAGCYTCDWEAHLDEAPIGERIWVGAHWRVAHAVGCALPGWLVVVPRRHTTSIAEHGPAEAPVRRLQPAIASALNRS